MRAHDILKRLSLVTLMLILLTTWGCTSDVAYHQYQKIDDDGWNRRDTLVFKVDSLHQRGNYATYVCLRTNPDFPYRFLSIVAELTVMPSGKTEHETIRCEIVNDEGVQNGVGIAYHTYEIPTFTGTYGDGDSLRIVMRHNMTREYMPGIMDVGVKVSRLDKEK